MPSLLTFAQRDELLSEMEQLAQTIRQKPSKLGDLARRFSGAIMQRNDSRAELGMELASKARRLADIAEILANDPLND